ncbi:VIT domain-containing protein [Xanthomonadaceae bacterium JHOS43]|nr:VIT domain-containing protein [Xanthomonadaceae bacterium JHOS43]
MTTLPKIASLIALAASGSAVAQRLPPQIWIPPQADLQPIVLDDVKIDVTMRGFLAHTRIDMTFANPNARVLEGEFVFPLGPGQTLSGYALEVDGAMREGVVVPKQTARVAFEDITRQQVDPGLAELTAGNVFRTRLYPIPASGKKRIALEFEQVMDDAGTHWRYLMPLHFRDSVRQFSVKAEVPLDNAAPELAADSPDPALHFERSNTLWRAEFSRQNITPQRELSFRVPKQPGDVTALEAPDTLEPAQRAILARIDTGRPDTLPAPKKPERIALYFDASGSARDRDLQRERDALSAWLATFDHAKVELIVFRDTAESARNFEVRNGDASALLAALDALPLDGASNYGAIDFRASHEADAAIVIGDGLDTFGSGQIDFSGAPARLFALHAAQRADHARLADIARRGNGDVIDLTRMSAPQASEALSAASWRLLSATSSAACADLLPTTPQPVGKVMTLTARCTGKTILRLTFGSGDGHHDVVREVTLGEAEPAVGALADSVWRAVAQTRITQMESSASPDTAAITDLAVRHGVVTSQTSLLVLDRIEDYVRYGVAPKEPDLRAQYERLRASQPKPLPVDAGRDARIASLATRWREFREWHQQRHPWLETLLAPAAEAETLMWQRLQASDTLPEKTLTASRKQLASITERSRALTERWLREGAEPASRRTWEGEATTLMLQLDALRQQRLEHAPDSAQWQQDSGHPLPSPSPVLAEAMSAPSTPPPPPERHAAARLPSGDSLDRVVVTGSRIESIGTDMAASPEPLPMQASMALSGWNPDTPYLKTLRAAADPYSTYLQLRTEHADTPSFFLDAADFFRNEAKNPALARRVLSNLAEIGDGNTALIRVFGYRLMQWDHPELALRPFEEALAQRPEEPQSHRDLALALSRLPEPHTARAVALLWHIATHEWHSRFPDIDLIALHELTALVAANPNVEIANLGIPPELLPPVEVNLRVVLTWDADNTDIDLWVIDPTGEAVYYAQPRSKSGGQVSRDFTQGYGPEAFTIARPIPGTYRVQAHYFGDRRQSLTGPVTVQLEFQTGFGSSEPERQSTTRRLETGKQRIDVGQFRIAP